MRCRTSPPNRASDQRHLRIYQNASQTDPGGRSPVPGRLLRSPCPTFRHELFEAYKAHRPETPPNLIQQIPKVKEFLECMRIPMYEFKATKLMMCWPRWPKKRNARVQRHHRHFRQRPAATRLGDGIHAERTYGAQSHLHAGESSGKYGVTPAQIRDFLGLVGDSSDNIPGIEGIAQNCQPIARTIRYVGSHFRHPDAVKNKKQQENLRQGREIALQSKDLATVRTTCQWT